MKKITMLASMVIMVLNIYGQDWDAVEIKTTKVADNIYMLEGRGGNIGVIVGEDGVMIVDNQYAPLADKIKSAITAISSGPIKYVINTPTGTLIILGETKFLVVMVALLSLMIM